MAVNSRTAATHRWMGQQLSTYDTAELRLILVTLEQVRFGDAVTYDNLDRWELLEAVCDLDLKLERDRRSGQRSTAHAARPPSAQMLLLAREAA